MLTVSGKTLGSKRPLFADFHVPPPEELSGGGGTTLRDLIEAVVRHEVDAFVRRQADRQFVRVLTQAQIEAGAESGKIDSGGSEVAPQQADPDQAVATALQAFEDGMYLVVVDDQEQRQLDQEVFVQPDSRLTFIRLSLLAGG
jgi:hypothetical protein